MNIKTYILTLILICGSVGFLSGCRGGGCIPPVGWDGCEQLGQTQAEGHRRHLRNARINHQEMMMDIDRFMLFDRPSRAGVMRIP